MTKYFLIFLAICTTVCAEIKNIVCYELDGNTILYNDDGSGKYKNPDPTREKRHGWYVIKRINTLSEARKVSIIQLLKEEKSYERGSQVLCYQPRFSIVYEEDGNKVEYHICLQCHNRSKYVNSKLQENQTTFNNQAYKRIKALIEGEKTTQSENKPLRSSGK